MEAKVIDEMNHNPDADWQREQAPELVAALEKGRTGGWRALFTASDRNTIRAIAGQTLVDWGYEESLDW
jgi:hypothetical protein